jgi:hypothetical protein
MLHFLNSFLGLTKVKKSIAKGDLVEQIATIQLAGVIKRKVLLAYDCAKLMRERKLLYLCDQCFSFRGSS